ncbi:MAG: pyridoxamine 5'-phosphate oxidase [Pseudomonadota bacterium]
MKELSTDREGIFAGENPFSLVQTWLAEAEASEPNDPNAMALSTVDADGLPNVRMVLLKGIEPDGFVFYTNYTSRKAEELAAGKAAFVIHWKSQRRQIRVRGLVEKYDGPKADEYYRSRSIYSRHGAWASDQSSFLENRQILVERAAEIEEELGPDPDRPPFWGGFMIRPVEMEFWADGPGRLHDRFRWSREDADQDWTVARLYP